MGIPRINKKSNVLLNGNLKRQRGLRSALVLISILFILPLFGRRTDYDGKNIKEIVFHGLNNSHPEELESIIKLQKYDPLRYDLLNEDLKTLFETGYFSNVVLRLQLNSDDTVTVHFEIWELPRISQIEFLGVDELYPADLQKILGFREGDVFSLQKVKKALPLIKEKYMEEGFFLAEVWYRTGKLNESSNSITVTYVVDEGENIPVSKINIIGTRQLDPDEIRATLEQKESGFLEDGIFREEKFEEDKLKIMAFAKSRGFIEAEIESKNTGYEIYWKNRAHPEEGRVINITYSINEGEKRYYGGYSLDHDPNYINQERNPPERELKSPKDLNPVYPPEFILEYLEFSESNLGEIFDEGKYFRDRGTLQEIYSRQGYVFAQVQPKYINIILDSKTIDSYEKCKNKQQQLSADEKRCKEEAELIDIDGLKKILKDKPDLEGKILRHVHFNIRENGLAYIENIIIKGMIKTHENVIRRELLIKEGQLFNSALVQRSREKIANLGFFKEVNLKSTPGSDETKMNLIIDVEEQPTGTISMGGGYGTSSGFMIFTEIGENNLNGTGQKISGRLDYGPTQRQVRMTWKNPWIHEACEDSSGSFWRNKQAAFDSALNLSEILKLSESLQNENYKYGEVIRTYVSKSEGDSSVESLDMVKARIRKLLFQKVAEEEDCFRSIPRPWSLSLQVFWSSKETQTYPILVKGTVSKNEVASIEKNVVGFGLGVSHTFLLNWAHYHNYSPSWSKNSRPTALVNDEDMRDSEIGWQFKSGLTNGILYDTRDSVFNPTTGSNIDISIQTVGQILGGHDHFNRYTASTTFYWWWFDYTFGGLIRKNNLRRWRVVQELRISAVLTHETAPFQGQIFHRRRSFFEKLNPFRKPKQDKETNAFIEPEERLNIGGYETLRGYSYMGDANFPESWSRFYGGSHMLLGSTELRFPIEPSVLWFVFFLDSGSLYNNLGELTGDDKIYVETYDRNINLLKSKMDPLTYAIYDKYNYVRNSYYFHGSLAEWNNPARSVFSQRNISLERTLFSWGFGFRIQIPVLPLRLYMAQKVFYHKGKLKPIPGDNKFEFEFGIGDYRFF